MLLASSTINMIQWLEPHTLSPKLKYCNVHCQEHIRPSCDAEEIDEAHAFLHIIIQEVKAP